MPRDRFAPGEMPEVAVEVTNTGACACAGDEGVQLHIIHCFRSAAPQVRVPCAPDDLTDGRTAGRTSVRDEPSFGIRVGGDRTALRAAGFEGRG